ncbi:MAG TPA: TolC family protein [Acidobacteriaceae bacterium]|nr:TolC family protein [Acidobacteriaceae bacterium]
MYLFRASEDSANGSRFSEKLKAAALISLTLLGTMPGFGQTATQTPANPAAQPNTQGLPPEPTPNFTSPLYLRPGPRDFTRPRNYWPNPFAPYRPTTAPEANFLNSPKLADLVRDGKIYLSLSDAIVLALENNYDIAIQRYNLDIADTDLLRAQAGSTLLGVPSGLVTGTLGGAGTTVTGGGGPGGTSVASGGAGAGAGGLALTTNGGGPVPENLDPYLTGTLEFQRQLVPEQNILFYPSGSLSQNTNQYNFAYNQGFLTGTALQVAFNNNYSTSNSFFNSYSPSYTTSFNVQLTQHVLQGFGWGVNGRFIVQAKNNRRIADSAFRQQLLYTMNQVEDIYWGLVSAYEDLQSKDRAVAQSSQLLKDNEKQLQIGTLAPLDVVSARSGLETDKQALIASQSNLEYQQLLMKQAISRNLNDPVIANAPVIPTDRVTLAETPEEHESVDELVRQADANSPTIEQAQLVLKNDKITLKGVKNGLLPTLDVSAFYGASALGGMQSPNCVDFITSQRCAPGTYPPATYGTAVSNLFNSSAPNKGVEFNLNIPIRNRTAQAEQARSVLEYRQAQMRLQQLYVQTKMQVINAQYALTNDRAAVQSATVTRDYDQQSLKAEITKLRLGASTTANVLQQQRTSAAAESTLIAATAKYAIDRASLAELLASTLDRYNISIVDAASGKVTAQPTIPGIHPAAQEPEVTVPNQQQNLQQQEEQKQHQPTTPPANPK